MGDVWQSTDSTQNERGCNVRWPELVVSWERNAVNMNDVVAVTVAEDSVQARVNGR